MLASCYLCTPTVPSIERQLQTSAFQVGQRNSHKKQKKPTACIPLQDEAQQPQPAGGLPNMQQTGEAVSGVRPKHSKQHVHQKHHLVVCRSRRL